MITRFYLPLLSTNVKHPKFRCHVTSLCQGLRCSAGSGGEDPENQVAVNLPHIKKKSNLARREFALFTCLCYFFGKSIEIKKI